MAKFKVGQEVIFDEPAREEVNLPNPIRVIIDKVIEDENISAQLYIITWIPTGWACVNERELSAATVAGKQGE